jgi:hypothetical protein
MKLRAEAIYTKIQGAYAPWISMSSFQFGATVYDTFWYIIRLFTSHHTKRVHCLSFIRKGTCLLVCLLTFYHRQYGQKEATAVVEMRAKNIPTNGPLLCERARSFARSLGFPEFMGSTGWLHRFQERYGISHKIINGEANNAPKEVASSWRLETLPAALKEYLPADI